MQDKLVSLGLYLPEVSSPGGNYQSVNIRKDIAFVAIQFPIVNGEMLYRGKLGLDIDTENGYKAMQVCALNVLAHINKKIGFERVVGLNHIEASYVAYEHWDEAPKVVDGASDLFVTILGDKGMHSRSLIGVASLPRNFSVGLTASFTIDN